jgi:hypothetical protein
VLKVYQVKSLTECKKNDKKKKKDIKAEVNPTPTPAEPYEINY